MPPDYATLELRIRPLEDDGYPVDLELAPDRHLGHGRLDPGRMPDLHGFPADSAGLALFAWLTEDLGVRSALDVARGAAPNLRIHLHIDSGAPELHALPWETMRFTRADGTVIDVAAETSTPFARVLTTGAPALEPLARPLRVLVAIAAPDGLEALGFAPIDAETEWMNLDTVFKGRKIEPIRLAGPCTLAALEEATRGGVHAVHLLAHGQFDTASGHTHLVLADEDNRPRFVLDTELVAMFTRLASDATPLRLCFLAACETAVHSPADAFRGLAPQLVRAGVPAVVAMQDLVPVETARTFSRTFYARLTAHGLVDLAANEARATLQTTSLPGAAIPVLFLRSGGERLLRAGSSAARMLALAAAALVVLLAAVTLGWFGVREAQVRLLCAGNPLCVIIARLAPVDDPLAQVATDALAANIDATLTHAENQHAVRIGPTVFSRNRWVDRAATDKAKALAQKTGALLVVFGNVTRDNGKIVVHFELVDLLGIDESRDLRTLRAQPFNYDPITRSIVCVDCLTLEETELDQGADVIAHAAAGFLAYGDNAEAAYRYFSTALACAGEESDALAAPLDLECRGRTPLTDFNPAILYYYAGKAATLVGNYAAGIALLEQAATANEGKDPAASLGIAAAYARWLDDPHAEEVRSAFTEAEARIDALITAQVTPAQRALLYHNLGLLHEIQEHWSDAAAAYGNAVATPSVDARTGYNSLVRLGYVQSRQALTDTARSTLESAVKLDARAPWAYLELAKVEAGAGRHAAAKAWLAKAEEVGPETAYVFIDRAELCAKKWDDLECARDAYAKAQELRPESGWLQTRMGDFYRTQYRTDQAESIEQAVTHYRAALTVRPGDPWAHEQLAFMLTRRNLPGDWAEAEGLLQDAIDLTYADRAPARLYCNLATVQRSLGRDAADAQAECEARTAQESG